MIGTNDLGLGIDPALIAENIRIIVTSIKTKSPSTEIYVQSVLPRKTRFREKIEELNALVRANTRSMSIWIDLYPIFLDSDGSIRNDLSNDELHLLGDGYALWRDRIARFMVSK
jgi:lysophospholipase L1-like esterase